jgi:hypothetical protein
MVLVCGLIVRERVSINKVVDDLSPIEKQHLFTVLEEKLDYPANLEESIRKKAIKTAISEMQPRNGVQGPFKKKM